MATWPATREELIEAQFAVAAERPSLWRPPRDPAALVVAGVFVCFEPGGPGAGRKGDRAWAAAAAEGAVAAVTGAAGAPYEAGLLALREGPLLEVAVRALGEQPELLLVDATGRDHPRRAGLALHLGAMLGIPTVGVTHRPLVAVGEWPSDERGARSPLLLEGEVVGYWLRTRPGRRPLAIHAAWRTDPDTAVETVLGTVRRVRTPEPLRLARRAARAARARRASWS